MTEALQLDNYYMVRRKPQSIQKNKTLFLGGLSVTTKPGDLQAYFSAFGKVSLVRIMREPSTNKAKGYGFISMASVESIPRIFANGPHFFEGRELDIQIPLSSCSPVSPPRHFTRLLISNLPTWLTQEGLANFFESFGPLRISYILKNKQGKELGKACVAFQREEDTQRVFNQGKLYIDNTVLEVHTFSEKEKVTQLSKNIKKLRKSSQNETSQTKKAPILFDQYEKPPQERKKRNTKKLKPTQGLFSSEFNHPASENCYTTKRWILSSAMFNLNQSSDNYRFSINIESLFKIQPSREFGLNPILKPTSQQLSEIKAHLQRNAQEGKTVFYWKNILKDPSTSLPFVFNHNSLQNFEESILSSQKDHLILRPKNIKCSMAQPSLDHRTQPSIAQLSAQELSLRGHLKLSPL